MHLMANITFGLRLHYYSSSHIAMSFSSFEIVTIVCCRAACRHHATIHRTNFPHTSKCLKRDMHLIFVSFLYSTSGANHNGNRTWKMGKIDSKWRKITSKARSISLLPKRLLLCIHVYVLWPPDQIRSMNNNNNECMHVSGSISYASAKRRRFDLSVTGFNPPPAERSTHNHWCSVRVCLCACEFHTADYTHKKKQK